MKFLLDTQAFLWFVLDDPRMTAKANALIEDISNEKLFSMASAWEIAIKFNAGKLNLSKPLDEFFSQHLLRNGIELLPISMPHIFEVSKLRLHHRDPFDRLLAAQSIAESIPIISNDSIFDHYTKRLW